MEFIVGTVLAGVPIVVKAYERYWQLSKGCSTFRHYSRELIKLDTIMKTQKTLFHGNIIKLLTVLTNDPTARDLLSDEQTWATLQIPVSCGEDPNRVDALREMFDSWQATLDLVLQSTETICLELEGFRMPDSRESLKQLSKRFRLSWKKSDVQTAIKELRDFTADFNELTARIVTELREVKSSPPATNTLRWRPGQLNSLEQYRQIRAASHRLYNSVAFRWSCSKHQRHAANISLVGDTKCPQPQEAGVKFDLAIDCASPSLKYKETPIWLEVEALDADSPIPELPSATSLPAPPKPDPAWKNTMQKITPNPKPQPSKPTSKKKNKKKSKKSVRIQPTPTENSKEPETPDSSTTTLINSPTQTNAMVNLDLIDDFCTHFQIPQRCTKDSCIGYIKDDGLHRFYLPGRQQPEQQMSLQDLITWVSDDEISRTLPRTTIAALACSLSTAILQYHSTPWLPSTWQSSHVRFFGIGELSHDASEIASRIPYFRVEMPKTDEENTGTVSRTDADAGATGLISLARNELLFRFGTVLLELGYGQPWPRLLQRTLKILPSHRKTGYHAAEKLAQAPLLRDRMGPKFTIIVRKCLGCDFGLGENDLANEQLQGVFLVDVVGALQEVEKGLKELELRLG